MARPRVYSNEQIIRALKEAKGMVYVAAEHLGCEANTIYNRAKRSPEVAAAMQHERGKVLDIGELKLYQAVQNGEPWAVTFLLKTLGKERGYTERQEVTGSNNAPIKHEVAVIDRVVANPEASRLVHELLAVLADGASRAGVLPERPEVVSSTASSDAESDAG